MRVEKKDPKVRRRPTLVKSQDQDQDVPIPVQRSSDLDHPCMLMQVVGRSSLAAK